MLIVARLQRFGGTEKTEDKPKCGKDRNQEFSEPAIFVTEARDIFRSIRKRSY